MLIDRSLFLIMKLSSLTGEYEMVATGPDENEK